MSCTSELPDNASGKMLSTMSPRPKAKSAPLVPQTGAPGGDAKDQLLCELELQQTTATKALEKLEHYRDELQALKLDFSLLFENSPIGYLTLDLRGSILNMNATALTLLGFERAKFMNVPLTFLVHKEDFQAVLHHL